jgi:hypothetical protein
MVAVWTAEPEVAIVRSVELLADVRLKTQCPLYPRKRTSLSAIAMSVLCQKRTSLPVSQSICRPGKEANTGW